MVIKNKNDPKILSEGTEDLTNSENEDYWNQKTQTYRGDLLSQLSSQK
jgi:hypothetical protein